MKRSLVSTRKIKYTRRKKLSMQRVEPGTSLRRLPECRNMNVTNHFAKQSSNNRLAYELLGTLSRLGISFPNGNYFIWPTYMITEPYSRPLDALDLAHVTVMPHCILIAASRLTLIFVSNAGVCQRPFPSLCGDQTSGCSFSFSMR
jgi:hypothetical protein